MKNWPGEPGSRPPRSSRSSVYGPTASALVTVSRSRLDIDSLLQRECELRARVCDRVHRRRRARDRRDARDPRDERRLADPVPIGSLERAAERRVDHEIAPAATDEVDDRGVSTLGDLRDLLDVQPGPLERPRGPPG